MRTVLVAVCVVFASPAFGQFDPKDMDKTGEWIRTEQLKLLEWKDNKAAYPKKQAEFDKAMSEAMVGKTFEWERKLQGGVSLSRDKKTALLAVQWSSSGNGSPLTNVYVTNIKKSQSIVVGVPSDRLPELKPNSTFIATGKLVSIERSAADRSVHLFVEDAKIVSK